jgi:hypothetical protein
LSFTLYSISLPWLVEYIPAYIIKICIMFSEVPGGKLRSAPPP